MTRKNLLDTAVPKLKQYMSEEGEPLTCGEVAKLLGVSDSAAYGVLNYMEARGILQHVKKGRTYHYFLKPAHDESHIAAMATQTQIQHRPIIRKPLAQAEKTTDSVSEEPVAGHHQLATGDMLPALAILGISQTGSSRPRTQIQAEPVEYPRKRVSTPLFITVSRNGRIEHLPKEARQLSRGHTAYLKEQYLMGLDGYQEIERFDCFFSEASALERGEYGNVFYASMGTNPWEKVYKVTVERAGEG
ncbi:hypothetical protein AC482_06610 [miscellaneous Crenarchaeota group-15 archaeon DG-45]|uniref:HTH arsR-type domain-containing protein n=1 Tax=miscellaneous Crenarchaeota group-15 archaeon DG-45 TaxID=1685127 RepID=A0A0M0BLT6_9ARCH|nr:MAG: hypothetical protein AC482_06610 [miscellaneous Crenarchaeota group-15 archaeon DG-45]